MMYVNHCARCPGHSLCSKNTIESPSLVAEGDLFQSLPQQPLVRGFRSYRCSQGLSHCCLAEAQDGMPTSGSHLPGHSLLPLQSPHR